MPRSLSGRTSYLPASANQRSTSSLTFSGCCSARSWTSARSSSVWNSCQSSCVEVADVRRHRPVLGHHLPAAVPERARAEHLVVLGRAVGGRVGVVEAVAHRLAGQRRLLVAADRVGHLDAAAVEDRRDDVGAVVVLVAHLAARLHPGRPVDHQRVADAALVGVALEHPERGRERERPAGRVVVVGVGRAELVDRRDVVLDAVRPGVEEVVLVDRAVRAALARGAVVGGVEDDRVVELPGLLEVVDDPPDLVVGVLRVGGVDLGHAGEQPLLVVGERVPRAHRSAGLVVPSGIGLIGVSSVSSGRMPFSIMRGSTHSR